VDVLALLDGIHSQQLPIWAHKETTMMTPLNVFISYSKADNSYKETLLNHLSALGNRLSIWHDHDILGGQEWDKTIKEQINQADVVLYLVSASSMATDYIQQTELPLIEARCQRGECKLIPVIVRACLWTALDFAKYNALPEKGIPITKKTHWDTEDDAWLNVAEGVQRLLKL
jgi:hypothetical protein